MKNSAALNKRNSSIELLKVFAILLIIAFHFIQTFTLGNPEFPNTEYLIDNYSPTTDVYRFILILMSGFGAVGNMIFFVCSAWFLLDSDRFNKRKEFRLISDVWIISVIIFAAVFFVRGGKIDGLTAVKQFFPITFSNNWYITCYLLFYPIHPFLNIIIGKITQKQHLVAASAMLFIYFGICFLKNDLMFISEFVVWVAAYFIIAYIKIYLKDAASSRR